LENPIVVVLETERDAIAYLVPADGPHWKTVCTAWVGLHFTQAAMLYALAPLGRKEAIASSATGTAGKRFGPLYERATTESCQVVAVIEYLSCI
jgi:hypothetical protein